MSESVYCAEKNMRSWKVYSVRIELLQERKVELMNDTRSYIGIQTSTQAHSLTHTYTRNTHTYDIDNKLRQKQQ